MNTFNQSSNRLHRAIMRRIWYSYFLSLAFSLPTLRGFVLGASAMLFVTLVSLPSIISNLLAVPLRTVPEYVWTTIAAAALNGEFLTLLTLGVIVFSLLSLRLDLAKFRQPRLRRA